MEFRDPYLVMYTTTDFGGENDNKPDNDDEDSEKNDAI